MSNKNFLKINNLAAGIDQHKILRDINMVVPAGKITIIMGPNGSGKSTLANVLMGQTDYRVTNGGITFQNKDLLKMPVWKRARLGIFLGFQQPVEIPGVSLFEFLLSAHQAVNNLPAAQKSFDKNLRFGLSRLKLSEKILTRPVNDGFSGGEKKKVEMLQLIVLQPRLAVLDEIDSGLDIDALKIIARSINHLQRSQMGFLIVTHYQRLLNYIKPDRIYVMANGYIVASGGAALAKKIERYGYNWLKIKRVTDI